MTLPEVIEVLADLRLPAGDWAVHGSVPLLAHGLVTEVADVDIVARAAAWSRAANLGPVGRANFDRVVRPLPGVEVFDGWWGEPADRLVNMAEVIGGLPCVPLEAVLEFKRRLGRPKDEAHIRLLERHLSRR